MSRKKSIWAPEGKTRIQVPLPQDLVKWIDEQCLLWKQDRGTCIRAIVAKAKMEWDNASPSR